MTRSTYETFRYEDPKFLITFHPERMVINRPIGFFMHWHEHLEILLFTNGEGTIEIEHNVFHFTQGDVAVINSNSTHSMSEKHPDSAYHCLIIDKQFAETLGISFDKLFFREHLKDCRIRNIFISIAMEMEQKEAFYKARVQGYAAELLVLLAREHSTIRQIVKGSSEKQKQIKKAIAYLSAHYEEPLDIETIAEQVGLSKYYFCRTFKEVTGQRAFDYINMMRCAHARKLLGMGGYNISESAFASGFNNLSYFTRTYKKFMGVPPSQDLYKTDIETEEH